MHIRFRQVRYFVEIVDSGSMTRAAERLNLAPTALSLQVRKLEEQFGVALLERHPRGVSPTPRGRAFYDSARRILDLLEETEEMFGGTTHSDARCRVGLSPSLLHAIDPAALLPGLHGPEGLVVEVLEGRSDDLLAWLEAGEVDFVVGWLGRHPESIRVVDFAEEAIVFVSSENRGIPGGTIPLESAVASDLIRIGRRSISWDMVCRRAALAGLHMHSVRVVESADLARRMLRDGLGTAILPITFIDPERRAGDVHVYSLAGEPLTRRLSLAWRKPVTGPVMAYIEGLVRALQALRLPHSRVIDSIADALIAENAASAGTGQG